MSIQKINTFIDYFKQLYTEDMTAGAGGAFGDAGSMDFGGAVPGGSDFYAPGDARLFADYGTFTRKGKLKKHKQRKKRKKRKTKRK